MNINDGSYQNAPSSDYNEMLEADARIQGRSTQFANNKQSFKNDTAQMDSVEGSKKDYMVNLFCTHVSHDLLVSRVFYFFFYAGFGSLFPLIAVYFKQLGMNPAQAGFLIGIRPFVEFVSAPFWGGFTIRYKKGRYLLLVSLVCWILFTVVLAFIAPTPKCCLRYNDNRMHINDSVFMLEPLMDPKQAAKEEAKQESEEEGTFTPFFKKNPFKTGIPSDAPAGIAPIYVTQGDAWNYDPKMGTLVRPPVSTRIYLKTSVEEVFLLLLLLVIIGEFFSAPAINLADALTLSYLEDNPGLFGRQRMFGSIGWGLAMFFVGIALDYSNYNHKNPCRFVFSGDREKNYTICFAVFSVLMACALIDATQFRFSVESTAERPDQVPQKVIDAVMTKLSPAVAEKARSQAPEPKEVSRGPEWLSTLKSFASAHYGVFLFVGWWFGFGAGLVFAFLFWHLQDIGGTPFLFGFASVLNHVSEVGAHFWAVKMINRVGHMYVLYIGLLINVLRFLYISILPGPWWVLPFEFVQGITHAAVWVAASSYLSLAAPAPQRQSAQKILLVLYHGLGKGCGAIIGGLIINYTGTAVMFRIYGSISLVVVAIFFGVNRYLKVDGIKYQTADFDEGALAPHGIPMNVPYSPSENMGDGYNQGGYGGGYQNLEPDPTQDAYDKYVHEPYDAKPTFETLPGSLR